MIKANELRVGNWVLLKEYNKRVCVFSISLHWKGVEYINNFPKEEIEPILLTDELLVACGFEKHKNSNEFWTFWELKKRWSLAQSHHSEISAGVKSGLFYWGDDYIEQKHLHQLQNLYFALTGQELEINLLPNEQEDKRSVANVE